MLHIVRQHYLAVASRLEHARQWEVLAKVKGVRRKAESEGRWRQNSAPTNRNHIRQGMRVRMQLNSKPSNCTESCNFFMAWVFS